MGECSSMTLHSMTPMSPSPTPITSQHPRVSFHRTSITCWATTAAPPTTAACGAPCRATSSTGKLRLCTGRSTAWACCGNQAGSPRIIEAGVFVASITTRLMTVAELDQLPESGDFYYELCHRESVKLTRPVLNHVFAQKQLQVLMEAAGV